MTDSNRRAIKTFLVTFAGVFLALLAFQGFQAAITRYREHRAKWAEIRKYDDSARYQASQHTNDPLLAEEYNCVALLTYTKKGGYAELYGADAQKCRDAYQDAELNALAARMAEASAEDKKLAVATSLKIKRDNEVLQSRIRKFFAEDVANAKLYADPDYVYRHCLINHSTGGTAHPDTSDSDAAVCRYISYGSK